jgi:DNA-binding transcriptional MerR regulator
MTVATTETSSERRLLTIGTVCRRLKPEFPDISISKIRYLEDQGLLSPRRTQGGYRLFGEEDVERLRTILRLQRDEFLPLRVIRQELSSPTSTERSKRRRPLGLGDEEELLNLDELCDRASVNAELVRELEEFGLLAPHASAGEKLYGETDAEIALACGKLSRYGVAPRHLRAFRTAADRESGLLEAVVAPALRSRNPERRQSGLEDLQALAVLAQELSQLLFWRALRHLAES